MTSREHAREGAKQAGQGRAGQGGQVSCQIHGKKYGDWGEGKKGETKTKLHPSRTN